MQCGGMDVCKKNQIRKIVEKFCNPLSATSLLIFNTMKTFNVNNIHAEYTRKKIKII